MAWLQIKAKSSDCLLAMDWHKSCCAQMWSKEEHDPMILQAEEFATQIKSFLKLKGEMLQLSLFP